MSPSGRAQLAGARSALAGLAYGLGLLAAGWIFGPIRVLALAPRIGEVPAAQTEAFAMMLWALWLSQLVVRGLQVDAGWRARLGMGLLGGLVVALGEVLGAQLLDGVAAFLDRLASLEGLIGLGSLLGAMIAPLAVLRPARPQTRRSQVGLAGPTRRAAL
jgi:hypothetical protein